MFPFFLNTVDQFSQVNGGLRHIRIRADGDMTEVIHTVIAAAPVCDVIGLLHLQRDIIIH